LNFDGEGENDGVGNDLGVEAGLAKFSGDIFGRLIVLWRSGGMRHSGQGLEVFAGEFCFRRGEEDAIPASLGGGEIAEPWQLRRDDGSGRLRGGSGGEKHEKQWQRKNCRPKIGHRDSA